MPTFVVEEFNHIANHPTMSAKTDDRDDAITRFRALVLAHGGTVPLEAHIIRRLETDGVCTVVNSGYGLSITQQ